MPIYNLCQQLIFYRRRQLSWNEEYKEWTSVNFNSEEAKSWIHYINAGENHKHSVSNFDQMTLAWEWVYTPSLPPLSPPTSLTSSSTTMLEPSVIWSKILVSLPALCSTSQEYGTNLWDRRKVIPHVLPAFFNKIGFFVGLALKKLKLCCHFLSWKSSERRNNLSYISVTYPGSAGW